MRTKSFKFCVIALIVIVFGCASTTHISVQSEIIRYKQTQVDELLRIKSEHGCPIDTLFFPDGYIVTFSDSSGESMPIKLVGLSQYILPIDSSRSIEEAVEGLIQSGKTTDTLSSFILKERLRKTSAELRAYVNQVSQFHSAEFATVDFESLIFENYWSCELSSEARLINGTYVIFLNDRLLDLCTWMSDLVYYRLTIPVDSAGNYVGSPQNEDEALAQLSVTRSRFVELVRHYLYDCPIRLAAPGHSVLTFRDYMELFILAHEYAHANFDHLSYQEAYGDILTINQQREIALNRWMNEIQADIFALNILQAKYYESFDTKAHLWLMTAGAFYLTCIEVLERSHMVINSHSTDGDEEARKAYEVFRELIRRIDPFPLTFAGRQQFTVDVTTKNLIDSLVDLRIPHNLRVHPPASARADILLNSLNMAPESASGLPSLEFGISMCQDLLNVFELSKEELCKE